MQASCDLTNSVTNKTKIKIGEPACQLTLLRDMFHFQPIFKLWRNLF